ncbi:MAG TPA: DMT family transporter, partial [Actinomycetota bacterium]|nr:DMT family transporter [Actinomycetota bacterium]
RSTAMMGGKHMRRSFVHLQLVSVALLWGGAFVAIKDLVGTVSPVTVTTLRFLLTGATYGLLLAIWPPARARIDRRDRGRLLVLAVTGTAGYHLALNTGERFVSAGVASLIVASMPVMVALLSARILRERIGAVKRAGIGLALAGVVLLTLYGTPGTRLELRNLGGALIAVLAPVCWAIHTVIAKPMASRYGAIPVTAQAVTIGSVLLLPFGAPATLADLPRLTGGDWAWLAFLAFGCTVYAYLIWNAALRRMEASTVAAYVYLVPVSSLAWAAIVLGERLTAFAAFGGALVLAGVILTERGTGWLEARRQPHEEAVKDAA